MKPRIRFSRYLDAWLVYHQPWPEVGTVTTMRHTWGEALALVGIRLRERWWE